MEDTEDQVSDKQRYHIKKGIRFNVQVQTINLIHVCIGTVMVFLEPLVVIDRRVVSIMSTHSQTPRVAHLRVYDALGLIRYCLRI
jgi:hypothetical protein